MNLNTFWAHKKKKTSSAVVVCVLLISVCVYHTHTHTMNSLQLQFSRHQTTHPPCQRLCRLQGIRDEVGQARAEPPLHISIASALSCSRPERHSLVRLLHQQQQCQSIIQYQWRLYSTQKPDPHKHSLFNTLVKVTLIKGWRHSVVLLKFAKAAVFLNGALKIRYSLFVLNPEGYCETSCKRLAVCYVSVVKWVFSAHVLESLRGELFSKQRRIVEQGLRRQRPYVVLLVFFSAAALWKHDSYCMLIKVNYKKCLQCCIKNIIVGLCENWIEWNRLCLSQVSYLEVFLTAESCVMPSNCAQWLVGLETNVVAPVGFSKNAHNLQLLYIDNICCFWWGQKNPVKNKILTVPFMSHHLVWFGSPFYLPQRSTFYSLELLC